MISRSTSFVLVGARAEPCRIEVDLSPHGLPTMGIVGLPDAAVRESAERVRTAVRHAGFQWPSSRLTVNLAPADRRKEGPVYDLPIALGVLAAAGIVAPERDGGRRLDAWIMGGELALDGSVRPVRGIVPMAIMARRLGAEGIVVPMENAREATLVDGLEVRAVTHLVEVVDFLSGATDGTSPPPCEDTSGGGPPASGTISESAPFVRGQPLGRRLAEIAAAGWHNLLLAGPPGCGKTMVARSISALLPPLDREAALEVAAIRSAAGLEPTTEALVRPPFRTPHHACSAAALVGGGSVPRPGEASLAHRGVLLLDEFAEFSRQSIDALREPFEDGRVTISRASGTARYPSAFLAVATFNPTRGREAWDPRDGCRRLVDRIGAPMLDRFDLHHLMERPSIRALVEPDEDEVAAVARARARVVRARRRAMRRQGVANGRLDGGRLSEVAPMAAEVVDRLVDAVEQLGLSARAFDRLRRVARTLADLDDRESIELQDVEEAVSYRLLDRT